MLLPTGRTQPEPGMTPHLAAVGALPRRCLLCRCRELPHGPVHPVVPVGGRCHPNRLATVWKDCLGSHCPVSA